MASGTVLSPPGGSWLRWAVGRGHGGDRQAQSIPKAQTWLMGSSSIFSHSGGVCVSDVIKNANFAEMHCKQWKSHNCSVLIPPIFVIFTYIY